MCRDRRALWGVEALPLATRSYGLRSQEVPLHPGKATPYRSCNTARSADNQETDSTQAAVRTHPPRIWINSYI